MRSPTAYQVSQPNSLSSGKTEVCGDQNQRDRARKPCLELAKAPAQTLRVHSVTLILVSGTTSVFPSTANLAEKT